jgi:phosphoglycolate phosphatase-like HAD superfamily hydrolase
MTVLLFDIDGTLTPGPDMNHQDAVIAALDDLFDVQVTIDEFQQRELQGLTTLGIAAALMRRRGREFEFGAQGASWATAMQQRFRTAATVHPKPFADARRAIETARAAGHQTALLTGNYKFIAKMKLSAVGLWDLFNETLGGFGDDGTNRDDVAAAAKRRIARRLGSEAWICVIGDTPRDVACGRAIGARAIGVTTGDFSASDLAEADATFATLEEAVQSALEFSPTLRA